MISTALGSLPSSPNTYCPQYAESEREGMTLFQFSYLTKPALELCQRVLQKSPELKKKKKKIEVGFWAWKHSYEKNASSIYGETIAMRVRQETGGYFLW